MACKFSVNTTYCFCGVNMAISTQDDTAEYREEASNHRVRAREIIPITEKAKKSIEGVPLWKI